MKLTIIGASGHGKVAANIAELCGYHEIEFLDDDAARSVCGKYPVVGDSSLALTRPNDVFVAIGNAAARKKLLSALFAAGRSVPTLVHPSAVVADSVILGRGTAVMAGAVLNPDVTLGDGVIINTGATVDHDSRIADYVHVAVGSHLCGGVTAGACTWFGAGSTVIQGVTVCRDCMIGAGAVVIRDIREPGTYVGVPAQRMK